MNRMEPMDVLIPRLWPFLIHTTSSVRKSTLQTLKTLTQCHASAAGAATAVNNCSSTNGSNDAAAAAMNSDMSKMVLSEQSASDLNKLVNVDAKLNLSLNFGVKQWPSALLQESLRHIVSEISALQLPVLHLLSFIF